MTPKNILLLEPGYKNKYPPLGLMKLAQYHRAQNPKHQIYFAKGESDPKLKERIWDRIYITTLFSFEWKKTEKCIDAAVRLANGKNHRIFVGGIAATLMQDDFLAEKKWKGVRFIRGILKDAPAVSLGLNGKDFGCKDLEGKAIDFLTPDYDILSQIEYRYSVHDAYFGYASRGCVRSCSFCGVPKLEGGQQDMPSLFQLVDGVDRLYGEKKDLVLMDNNVTAAPKFHEIMAEIRDLGFTSGAQLDRGRYHYKRRVDFNQGVDSRLLVKNPRLVRDLATICIDPLRIAFDHVGMRNTYERAVRDAADNGITSLSNYMLYNYNDNPRDLYQRLRINIVLNEELGVRIWSFPMRYQPVTLKDRSHVGPGWNRYFLRSFQIILQATHGVVSGNPDFFNRAFGENEEAFIGLLSLPHEFIFNRDYYFNGDGLAVLEEYLSHWNRLSGSQRKELIALLSGSDADTCLRPAAFSQVLLEDHVPSALKKIARFYIAYCRATKVNSASVHTHRDLVVPDEARVEDAGLYDIEAVGSHREEHEDANFPKNIGGKVTSTISTAS